MTRDFFSAFFAAEDVLTVPPDFSVAAEGVTFDFAGREFLTGPGM
jgi:hypothetical protein